MEGWQEAGLGIFELYVKPLEKQPSHNLDHEKSQGHMMELKKILNILE